MDATTVVGEYSSLALDDPGEPHIAYNAVNLGDLKYAARSGGTWTLETVDDGTQLGQSAPHVVGQYASLKLDAQGNPRIAYRDDTTWDLKYAEWGVH